MPRISNRVDGQTYAFDGHRGQVIEARTGPCERRSSFRFRYFHGLILAALLVSAVLVPEFLLTFMLLALCVVVSLVAFIILVQMPVQFFASRLRQKTERTEAAKT